MVDTVSLNTAEGANMKVVSWDLYRMRRQARLNGGHTMPLGMAGETPAAEQRSRTQPASSDRIRIDCLHRYVKAQLLPKSTK
jgi:hypothetical protein